MRKVVAFAVAALFAACGEVTEPATQMGVKEPLVPVASGDALVPSDLPGGFRLESADAKDAASPNAVLRLYEGDERSLLVAYQEGSETGPALSGNSGAEEPTGTSGDASWAARWVQSENQEKPQVAVVGRGYGQEELVSILRDLDVDEEDADASLAEVPDGMSEVAAARVSAAALANGVGAAFPAARLVWRDGQKSLQLMAARHDPVLSQVLNRLVDTDSETSIRGERGRRGRSVFPNYDGERVAMWTCQWPT